MRCPINVIERHLFVSFPSLGEYCICGSIPKYSDPGVWHFQGVLESQGVFYCFSVKYKQSWLGLSGMLYELTSRVVLDSMHGSLLQALGFDGFIEDLVKMPERFSPFARHDAIFLLMQFSGLRRMCVLNYFQSPSPLHDLTASVILKIKSFFV